MKKFTILFILLFLVGCSNSWENKIQVSELKYDGKNIVGQIKNLTDTRYKLNIDLEFKSGSLEKEETCNAVIESKQTIDFECENKDINTSYSINIKDIVLTEIRKDELIRDENELKKYPKIKEFSDKIINKLKEHPEFKDIHFDYLSICYDECSEYINPVHIYYDIGNSKRILLEYSSNLEFKEISVSTPFPRTIISKNEKITILNLFSLNENSIKKEDINKFKNIINNKYSSYSYYDNIFSEGIYSADKTFYIHDCILTLQNSHIFSISVN